MGAAAGRWSAAPVEGLEEGTSDFEGKMHDG